MSKILIINAIIWALVILIAAYLFNDHENYKYLFGVLIVAVGLENALISFFMKKKK